VWLPFDLFTDVLDEFIDLAPGAAYIIANLACVPRVRTSSATPSS
jgi:hypothetical protein